MAMSRDRLRILVYPHDMAMGGSQLNAIELAAAVRDLGHTVAVVGDDGPLVRLVHDLGLRHIPVPAARRRPSPAVARDLRRLVRAEGVDIVHGYEWPPGLEAYAAVSPLHRSAAVCTVMSMAVAPFLPASLPLVVGTRAIQEKVAAGRPGPVHLIEPPVDMAGEPAGPSERRFPGPVRPGRYGDGRRRGGLPAGAGAQAGGCADRDRRGRDAGPGAAVAT